MSSLPRFVPRFLSAAVALVSAACDGGPHRSNIPEALIAPAPWEASFDPSERTAEIHGVVFETEELALSVRGGTPAAGARVELLVPAPDGRGPFTTVAETTTGADGRYSLRGAPATHWAVRASKPGFAPTVLGRGTRFRGVIPAPVAPLVELTLHPSRRLTGRVTDRAGRPVVGVLVEGDALAWFDSATTGPDGTFSMDAPRDALALALQDPAWEPVRLRVDAVAETVEITTVQTPVLSGRVYAVDDGRPLEGAVVTSLAHPELRTRTDAEGRWTLAVPRWGRLAFLADGYSWTVVDVPRAADVVLGLRPVSAVQGRVVDADGKPVEDARVVCVAGLEGVVSERAFGPRTAADGSFRVTWRPRLDPGYRSFVVAWHRRLGISQPVALPWDGETTFRLSRARTVAGDVVNAEGRPVGAAVLSASWGIGDRDEQEAMMTGLPLERLALAAADGRFALEDVPSDREVHVTAEVFGVKLTQTVAAGAAVSDLRFTLPPGRRLSGRVMDVAGKAPPSRALVLVRLLDVPGAAYERDMTAAEDGTFAFEGAPIGRYAVEARADGFDRPAAVNVEAGDDDVKLVLERSAMLSVTLAPPEPGAAAPAPSTPLTVWIDDLTQPDLPPHRTRLTAKDLAAAFSIAKFRAGRWRVRVQGDDWAGVLEPVELGDGEVRTAVVVLRPTVRAHGVVRNANGVPAPSAPILLVPLDLPPGPAAPGAPKPVAATSDRDGAFSVGGLAAGRWQLRATPRDAAELITEVRLPSAEPLDLKLPPSGNIRVLVLTKNGDPAPEAIVRLEDAAGHPVAGWADGTVQLTSRFRADAQGVVLAKGIPVGTVRVAAEGTGVRSSFTDVKVADGQTVETTLR